MASITSWLTFHQLKRHGYRSLNFIIDSLFIFALLMLPLFLHHALTTGYTLEELFWGSFGSAIQSVGNFLFFDAMTTGLAGPLTALCHT